MYFDNWQDQARNDIDRNNNSSLMAFFNTKNNDELARMADDVSMEAKDFFDASVAGLLGQLPEEIAETTITMSKSSLQQLLFSSMLTGYVAKSVENKLALEQVLNSPISNQEPKSALRDRLNKKPRLN